jgi:hypothetical protein
MGRHT